MDVDVSHGPAYGETLTWAEPLRPEIDLQKVHAQVDLDLPRFKRLFVELMSAAPPKLVTMAPESAIRREVGAVALMFTGLGSIIGSGWLFGAWRAAQLAGPGAIYAWLIGAVVILFVALTYAELGAMFPESGGAVRYGHYSHGSLVGFAAGWAAWIAIVSVIPVEAEASVQYMSSWPWPWAQALYLHAANGQGELRAAGLTIAAMLVVVYFLLNFWSVKVFAGANSAITFFKLIVPAATAVALPRAASIPGISASACTVGRMWATSPRS